MARNVLIIKLAAVGDVVMALPMVTALRQADPAVRITWLCGRAPAPLLRHVEGIDEIVVVDEAALLAGSTPSKVRALLAAWNKLALRRFDAVYVAHSDSRYQALSWPVRTGLRRGLDGAHGARGIVPSRAHRDEYVRLVTGLDDHRATPAVDPPLRLDLPQDLRRRLDAFGETAQPLVAITPGGARNAARENALRRWPLERYAELVDMLVEQQYRVVVTGSGTDGWVRPAFRGKPVLDLIGATDLPGLATLLRECAAVIGHDSGPLHIARFVGTPVVALLGPTPPTMFFRWDPRFAVMWPGGKLACAPCYDGRDFADCQDNVCMKMIECRDVIARLALVVRKSAPRRA